MKFIHLSDLHIGKRVNEFSMIEDQRAVLAQIVVRIEEESPYGVFIAGDVYDKSVPPAEAVELFDHFLTQLVALRVKVFLISGNHDSPQRLAFASRLLQGCGVYFSSVYDGKVERISLEDGGVDIFLLPFIKPAHVRSFFPDSVIESYTDGVRVALSHCVLDANRINILLTHQFVTGATTCDSEDLSVGGSDNVDLSVFDGFDYVALGHLHGAQWVGRESVRYCGSPLKYSFSEANQTKSLTVLELRGAEAEGVVVASGELAFEVERSAFEIRTIPLIPRRDLREIRGSYEELTLKSNYENTEKEDYLHITLTDEEDILDAIGKLRSIYPNIMKLDYDNLRTQGLGEAILGGVVENRSPLELFEGLYVAINGQSMSEVQRKFTLNLIEKIVEEGV